MPIIAPLATKIRPTTLDQIIGQKQILDKGTPFRKMIESDQVKSIILHGPAGTGKTTLADVISKVTKRNFVKMNATNATVKEIKALGERTAMTGANTILFIDEIHRFSSTQQDALLPLVESGTLVFIGATTENPFHSVNSPLLSRCQIVTLEALTEVELTMILLRGVEYYRSINKDISLDPEAVKHIIRVACGDGRKVLSILELVVDVANTTDISYEIVKSAAPSKYMVFDTNGHFDLASAFQGSIQASDVDAAVYWLAKWLESGEDPRYIARRLMVSASEDACSTPVAAMVAHSAYISACEIGRPECDIILAHATVLVASAPRDKSAAMAVWSALKDVKEGADVAVPKELRDCHYKGAEKLGHGQYKDGMRQDQYVGVKKTYYIPWVKEK